MRADPVRGVDIKALVAEGCVSFGLDATIVAVNYQF